MAPYVKVPYAELPKMLRELVASTGVRPREVHVNMVADQPSGATGLGGGVVRGIGKETVLPTKSWMGEDGESYWQTEIQFEKAACTGYSKCGRARSRAYLTLGGLPADFKGTHDEAYEYCLSVLLYDRPPYGYVKAAPAKPTLEDCWDYWLGQGQAEAAFPV